LRTTQVLLAALLCSAALAGSGPVDYSGTWKLNTNKSTQDGPADRVYIKTIQQSKKSITVTTKADGVTNLIDGTYPISDKYRIEKQGNLYRYTRAYWEAGTIKFELADKDSKKDTAKTAFYIREGWTLSADGKVLTTFRQTAQPPKVAGERTKVVDQKYVFDKQ
jgi:hypothetical protein